MIQFKRTTPATARGEQDAVEYLQLVRVTVWGVVESYGCAALDGREYPYAVQVTTGSRDAGTTDPGDFGGVWDLDGDDLHLPIGATWEIVEGAELAQVPAEVIRQLGEGWEYGGTVVQAASPAAQAWIDSQGAQPAADEARALGRAHGARVPATPASSDQAWSDCRAAREMRGASADACAAYVKGHMAGQAGA